MDHLRRLSSPSLAIFLSGETEEQPDGGIGADPRAVEPSLFYLA